MGKATFIRKLSGWKSDARLYKLDPAAKYELLTNGAKKKTRYVVVSAVSVLGEPETLVFPSSEDGDVTKHHEIGGFKGSLDHERALKEMGYDI